MNVLKGFRRDKKRKHLIKPKQQTLGDLLEGKNRAGRRQVMKMARRQLKQKGIYI